MRPWRTQTAMNLYQYEIFAADYMKPGRDAWYLVSEWNDIMFCLTNIWADQKAYRLQISGPLWDFSSFTWDQYELHTGARISRLCSTTERKSDIRSEFVVRPVSCKRIKRNVWRPIRTHTGLSLSRSHVNNPFNLVTNTGPLTITSWPTRSSHRNFGKPGNPSSFFLLLANWKPRETYIQPCWLNIKSAEKKQNIYLWRTKSSKVLSKNKISLILKKVHFCLPFYF